MTQPAVQALNHNWANYRLFIYKQVWAKMLLILFSPKLNCLRFGMSWQDFLALRTKKQKPNEKCLSSSHPLGNFLFQSSTPMACKDFCRLQTPWIQIFQLWCSGGHLLKSRTLFKHSESRVMQVEVDFILKSQIRRLEPYSSLINSSHVS